MIEWMLHSINDTINEWLNDCILKWMYGTLDK